MKNLIVITGPTAVGKTSISIDVANAINGEIISADSMQIYKKLNIGTAKVTKSEMGRVPHHLIDIVDPIDRFNVSEYKNLAVKTIDDIHARNNIPIIVGGTGLYINSVIFDYDFSIQCDMSCRCSIEKRICDEGLDNIYNELINIDQHLHKFINRNDKQRIIRAYEVYEQTGNFDFVYDQSIKDKNLNYSINVIVLNMERKNLYNRIEKRVDQMINDGLFNEVKDLLNQGLSINNQCLQGIGYKETINYLNGNISRDQAIQDIKMHSRRYAKRQLTWFRKIPNAIWIDVEKEQNIVENIINNVM